jgi:hypothetical protein
VNHCTHNSEHWNQESFFTQIWKTKFWSSFCSFSRFASSVFICSYFCADFSRHPTHRIPIGTPHRSAGEDRWAHVAWGFMAVYHVAASAEFAGAGLNALVDMEAVRAGNAAAAAAASQAEEEAEEAGAEKAAEDKNSATAAVASTVAAAASV